jgi:sirohydrochlorin cobaltochelatase
LIEYKREGAAIRMIRKSEDLPGRNFGIIFRGRKITPLWTGLNTESPDHDIEKYHGQGIFLFQGDEIMIKNFIRFMLTSLSVLLIFSMAYGQTPRKAIVLASFGTSHPDALKALTTIEEIVQKDHPDYMVTHAFTSNIIRKIWHDRQNDTGFLEENKEISRDFLYVKSPLATVADLQDQGIKTIVVQPTHVFAGESYADLCAYMSGLNSIKTLREKYMPFDILVLGRPALGAPSATHFYQEDIQAAANALENDIKKAKKMGAAMVYMGHGNEIYSTGAYVELEDTLRKTYPDTRVFIGAVEGFPLVSHVAEDLKHAGIKKVFMKPLMVVAGDHAGNDMAGDEQDSWKTRFEQMGMSVTCDITGLGENTGWAKIYSDHIFDVIKDAGIK